MTTEPSASPVRYRLSGEIPDQISELVRLLNLMVDEAVWPTEGEQGKAQAMLAWDLQDCCFGLSVLVREGAWSAALALNRPIQERFEALLASTLDPNFAKTYLKRGVPSDEPAKIRAGVARSVLNKHLEMESNAMERNLSSLLNALSWGSTTVHPTIDSANISLGLAHPDVELVRDDIQKMAEISGGMIACATLVTYMSVAKVGGMPGIAAKYACAAALNWLVQRGIATLEELVADGSVEFIDRGHKP